jgi:hypothetical protein
VACEPSPRRANGARVRISEHAGFGMRLHATHNNLDELDARVLTQDMRRLMPCVAVVLRRAQQGVERDKRRRLVAVSWGCVSGAR